MDVPHTIMVDIHLVWMSIATDWVTFKWGLCKSIQWLMTLKCHEICIQMVIPIFEDLKVIHHCGEWLSNILKVIHHCGEWLSKSLKVIHHSGEWLSNPQNWVSLFVYRIHIIWESPTNILRGIHIIWMSFTISVDGTQLMWMSTNIVRVGSVRTIKHSHFNY